jgi:hypothetical protein
VLGVGEIYRLPECLLTGTGVPEQCACGKLLKECAFWAPVLKVAEEDEVRKMSFDEWNTVLLTKLLEFKMSANVILDSSCDPKRLELLLDSSIAKDYKIKVIYMSRDARGVIYSRVARGFGGTGIKHSTLRSAVGWRLRNTRSISLLRNMHIDDYMHLTYEDFCRDTDTVITRIQRFIGIKATSLTPNWRSFEHHTFCGNIRLINSKEDRIVEDLEWRTGLSKTQRLIIELLCGALNRRVMRGID